jgi:hypothetical protein
MEANMFDFLNTILGFYANCDIAWIVVAASDTLQLEGVGSIARRLIDEQHQSDLAEVWATLPRSGRLCR